MSHRPTVVIGLLVFLLAGVSRAQDTTSEMLQAIRDRQYDRGIELLAKRIEANPDDAGQDYDPSTDKKLSPEALHFGRDQLLRMLRDRPVMRNHADENGILARWAIRKFAGEDSGFLIRWDSTPPQSGAFAENLGPNGPQLAFIRVAKVYPSGSWEGHDLTFEQLWAAAVFELHNVINSDKFRSHTLKAVAGVFDRDTYVKKMFTQEFFAVQQARAFYCHIYLPMAKEQRLRTDPEYWFTNMWGSADDCLKLYYEPTGYPYSYYGPVYDSLVKSRTLHDVPRQSQKPPADADPESDD